jgi:hypothetical protein
MRASVVRRTFRAGASHSIVGELQRTLELPEARLAGWSRAAVTPCAVQRQTLAMEASLRFEDRYRHGNGHPGLLARPPGAEPRADREGVEAPRLAATSSVGPRDPGMDSL